MYLNMYRSFVLKGGISGSIQENFHHRISIELCNTTKVCHTPLPFHATKKICPFLNSRILAIMIK